MNVVVVVAGKTKSRTYTQATCVYAPWETINNRKLWFFSRENPAACTGGMLIY